MPATEPALISRLRRRLAGVAWLFALLVLAKGAVAAACVADGLGVASSSVVSVASGASLVAASAAAATDDAAVAGASSCEADAACWHAGSGGCHCSCVHVTPLAPHALHVRALVNEAAGFPPRLPAARTAPRDDHLRPPIA